MKIKIFIGKDSFLIVEKIIRVNNITINNLKL